MTAYDCSHSMRHQTPPKINVLALSGGGVRCYIQAIELAEIEKRTEQLTAESFDLIAGTSGGAINAGLLTVPGPDPKKPKFTAATIKESYPSLCQKAFTRTWSSYILRGPKYNAEGLENVLTQFMGDHPLQHAVTKIVIPALQINPSKPVYFKSFDKEQGLLNLIEVIRASSAAPTYYPTKIIGNKGFIDGGMFANDPSLAAFAVADSFFPNPNYNVFLSLETGDCNYFVNAEQSKGYGTVDWLINGELVDITFKSSSQVTDLNLRYIFPKSGIDGSYQRLNPPISEKNSALDNTSLENMKELEEKTKTYIEEKTDVIRDICHKLEKDKGL